MEGQPPRNHTTSIAVGGPESDDEVSDFENSSDDDESPYRKAAYQANMHTTSHRTRGATKALVALAQTPAASPAPPVQPRPPPPPPPLPPPPPQQQQPQPQQHPPSPLPAFPLRCIANKQRGKNAGSVCGYLAGTRKAGYCQHHDGQQQKRCKVAAASPQPGVSGADEDPDYGSDGDPGRGVDELQTPGAESQQSKKEEAHYSKADKIADPGFDAAYKTTWHLKKQPVAKPTVSF